MIRAYGASRRCLSQFSETSFGQYELAIGHAWPIIHNNLLLRNDNGVPVEVVSG